MIFVIEFSLKYKMIFIYFLILRKKCDVHFSKSIYLSIWIWGVGILATEDRSEVYLALPAYNHFTTFIYLCLCLKSVFYLLFKYQPSVIVKTESICCCFSSRLQQRATLRETKPVWLVFQWNQKQMFSRMFCCSFTHSESGFWAPKRPQNTINVVCMICLLYSKPSRVAQLCLRNWPELINWKSPWKSWSIFTFIMRERTD